MSKPADRPALTLAAAAERLGVSQQRISQLLSARELRGPSYVGRAPKLAPRVWESSISEYTAGRHSSNTPSRKALASALKDCTAEKSALEQDLIRADSEAKEDLRDEVVAARSAAEVLNVGHSAMVDRVASLTETVKQLRRDLADKEIEFEALKSQYEALELSYESKSDALTQLLVNSRPPRS